jgi:hypothetical protein
MKRILALVVFGAILSLQLFSQKQINHDDLRTDIRTYAEQNIHPQMKIWKSQIDQELNSEELAILNNLRAKAAEFKKDGLEHMRNFTPDRGSKGERKGMKGERKEMKGERGGHMKEFHAQLNTIIENHESYFASLTEKIAPLAEKWRTDMQSMKREWKQENIDKPECENKSENCPADGKGKGKHKKGNKFEKNPQHQLYRVMLWDGSNFDSEGEMFHKSDKSMGGINSTIYPNPSNNEINLEFNAPTQGVYELIISDASGNVVSKQNVNATSTGKINHVITGLNIGNGVYNYTITNGGKMESGRFAIQK